MSNYYVIITEQNPIEHKVSPYNLFQNPKTQYVCNHCIDIIVPLSHYNWQEALKALWHASFPETELTGLVSEQWKDIGWQGPNPSTDFR